MADIQGTTGAPGGTPAGWYPDPQYPGQQRWWDGNAWSSHTAPGVAPAYAAPKTNGFAIASMILGILWLYWIGSIFALVFGYKARREIEESNGQETGHGFATAGIVLGWIGIATTVIVLIAIIAITFLGNEANSKFSIIGPNVNNLIVHR